MTKRIEIESVALNAETFARIRTEVQTGKETRTGIIYKDATEGSPLKIRVGRREISLVSQLYDRAAGQMRYNTVYKILTFGNAPLDCDALGEAIRVAGSAKEIEKKKTPQEVGKDKARVRTLRMTYREWAKRYFDLLKTESDLRTIDSRRRAIYKFLIDRPLPLDKRSAKQQTYGDLKPGDVTLEQANEWRREIACENGKHHAKLVRAYVNSMFSFLSDFDGFAEDLRFPITNAVKFTEEEKEKSESPRPLSDAQIKMLWDATEQLDDLRRKFVRFLMFSARRRAEVERLQWDWIQWEDGYILYPSRAMKNKAPFAQPLTPAIIDILENMPKFGDCVFSLPSGKPMGRDDSLIMLLDARMTGRPFFAKEFGEAGLEYKRPTTRDGAPFPYRIHSLRSTATRLLQRADKNLTEIHFQYLLAHAGVKGAIRNYVSDNLEKKKEMLEMLEAEIIKLVNPPTPEELKERALSSIVETMNQHEISVYDVMKAKKDGLKIVA